MTTPVPAVTEIDTFAADIERGLTQKSKTLPSKYFYDVKGDTLFQQIMAMPAYYLTNCEYDIFTQQAGGILAELGDEPFELIELGAGDGTKTKILLSHFLDKKVDFRYRPIDISGNILQQLVADCQQAWPQLVVAGVEGDYFKALQKISAENNGRKKVILFLGSNIGNFTADGVGHFLHQLHNSLTSGDQVLIGFDLKKDPDIILRAYNDPAGVTAAFNINLLERINREYNANFDLARFRHWPTYDPVSGEARSFLVSEIEQSVQIDLLHLNIHFEAWEAIHVETSAKYSLTDIQTLASANNFKLQHNFIDEQEYFSDSLWQVD